MYLAQLTYLHDAVKTSAQGPSLLKVGLVLLALPITITTGLWLLTGARRWCHIAAFSLGSVLFGAGTAYQTIYVFHQVDWKFREAPRVAFEVGLASAGVINVATALAFTLGLLLAEYAFKSDVGRRHWAHSLLAGALTALLAGLLLGQTATDFSLGGLVVLPVAYALVWFRKPGKEPGASAQGAV
jgi:uncharacterized membrane protein